VTGTEPRLSTARERAFEILEHGRRRDLASRILDWFLVAVILANVAGTIANTSTHRRSKSCRSSP
jgi:predicted nucleic acid-binding Zn ribbon protein